jgi:hypothetical protein
MRRYRLRPWGPDGAILCNCYGAVFKLNFQYFNVLTVSTNAL